MSRTFILGIDGLPCSFIKEKFEQGWMPRFARLFAENNGKSMHSVYPTVSSVAWTSFAAGVGPAGHGIFGFVDRVPGPFQLTIPTARDRKRSPLWKELSDMGKKVIVINVPLTYPPEPVNGILTSGFLCTDITKSSYPPKISSYLQDKGYIIDVDAWLAKEDKPKLMADIHTALAKRFEVAFELMDAEQWDYFQLHIMETDRLFHFYWQDIELEDVFFPQIKEFFEKLDMYIGQLCDKLSDNDRLILLSDHGFCATKYEVQLNVWLEQQGLLTFPEASRKISDYLPASKCYSLLPGRIFINLAGREEKGSVLPADYDAVREDIKQQLLEFTEPRSGEKVIDTVFFREEIYDGPYLEQAADIIAHPNRGYDLKGKTDTSIIFDASHVNGMHTCYDAFICGKNCDITSVENIKDVKSVIMAGY